MNETNVHVHGNAATKRIGSQWNKNIADNSEGYSDMRGRDQTTRVSSALWA